MQTSPSISNLTKALLVAQKQMGAAVKGSKNPFFKSNYADLPTVMEVVKGPLNDAGVLILQPAIHRDGRNFIQTVLVHAETGEMLVSETEVICSKERDPQAFGAAQTYARRFGLQAMVFIPSEDDDGNKASGRDTKSSTRVEVPKTLPTPATTAEVLGHVPSGVTVPLNVSNISSGATAPNLSVATTQTVADVQPLKTSNFRKKKEAKTETVATSSDGWDS